MYSVRVYDILRVLKSFDFGVLNIIINIFKTMQILRFWCFCSGRKLSDFGVFAYTEITFDFGVLNIIIDIFKTMQILRFWSFFSGRKLSDFGVFAYTKTTSDFGVLNIINIFKPMQNLQF